VKTPAPIDAGKTGSQRIRVLVIDDSPVMRRVLTELIGQAPGFEVVGAAQDATVARDMIRKLNPDVLTLDVEMPKIDGFEFLEKLMRVHPMPVLMVSSFTEKGSETTLRALELGAVDFVAKPRLDAAHTLRDYGNEILDKLRIVARARVRRTDPIAVEPANNTDVILPLTRGRPLATEKLIIVGASTGGTEAVRQLLTVMPADCPGILITQHMPEAFTKSFAKRLDMLATIKVKEAQDGERILPGHAYIAPGNAHLLVRRNGTNYVTELNQGPPVNRHRPSVDVLFRSAANNVGSNALGVILTGMGKDGAAGMLEMKQAGAHNIAQDEASCVVFGMPREAIALGGVDETLAVDQIAPRIIALLNAARLPR